jgi:hypothetical protein
LALCSKANKHLRITVLCDGDYLAQLLTTGEVVVDFLPCCVTSVQCLPEIPAQVRQPKERRKNHEANTTQKIRGIALRK